MGVAGSRSSKSVRCLLAYFACYADSPLTGARRMCSATEIGDVNRVSRLHLAPKWSRTRYC